MADEPVNEEEAQTAADFKESGSEPMAAKASEPDKAVDQSEKPNASSAEKKPTDPKGRTHTIIAIAVVVAAMLGGSAYWYVNYQIPHQKAVEAFNAESRCCATRGVRRPSSTSTMHAAGCSPLRRPMQERIFWTTTHCSSVSGSGGCRGPQWSQPPQTSARASSPKQQHQYD